MLNEKNIRQALDRRLSGLTASEERRNAILQAARQERREDKPVRSKKTLVIAIALILAMLTSAAAVAETLNLFDFFGKEDARIAALAPKATLEISEPALIEHPYLGDVAVKIDSAYFDGLAMSMTYQIDNSLYAEEYTPTEEEIARMKLDEPVILAIVGNEPYVEVHEAYNEAVENGTPFGYKQYTVRVHDHTYSDDGIDLGGGMGYEDYNGTSLVGLLDFDAPLADELRSRDDITVVKGIFQHECTVWFDGKECDLSYAMKDIGEIRATIPKAQGQVKTFSGTGRIKGVETKITAEVSPLAAVVTMTCEQPVSVLFEDVPADIDRLDMWGEIVLVDEANREYGARNGFAPQDGYSATVSFVGAGALPETLNVYVFTNWEGCREVPALKDAESILLTEIK